MRRGERGPTYSIVSGVSFQANMIFHDKFPGSTRLHPTQNLLIKEEFFFIKKTGDPTMYGMVHDMTS